MNERPAIAEVKRLNGLFYETRTFSWFSCRKRVTSVQVAWQPKLSDEQFAFLADFRHLEFLQLRGNGIKGDCLKYLKCKNRLRLLDLGMTQVDDSAISLLSQFVNLDILCLDESRVSNVGIRSVAGLNRLNYLALNGTSVSLEGVLKLLPLRDSLEILTLEKAHFSPRVRKYIEAKFSRARIDWFHGR